MLSSPSSTPVNGLDEVESRHRSRASGSTAVGPAALSSSTATVSSTTATSNDPLFERLLFWSVTEEVGRSLPCRHGCRRSHAVLQDHAGRGRRTPAGNGAERAIAGTRGGSARRQRPSCRALFRRREGPGAGPHLHGDRADLPRVHPTRAGEQLAGTGPVVVLDAADLVDPTSTKKVPLFSGKGRARRRTRRRLRSRGRRPRRCRCSSRTGRCRSRRRGGWRTRRRRDGPGNGTGCRRGRLAALEERPSVGGWERRRRPADRDLTGDLPLNRPRPGSRCRGAERVAEDPDAPRSVAVEDHRAVVEHRGAVARSGGRGRRRG